MMKRIDIEKTDDGRFDHYFEGDGYGSEKVLKEWMGLLADSGDWTVKSCCVKEMDDMDAPVDKYHDYDSLDALKTALESEIPELDMDWFYISGDIDGTDVAVTASVEDPKSISVLGPEDFDSTGFLKNVGIN